MNVTRDSSAPSAEPRVVVVVGPTASGKTSLAVDVAVAVGGEVVNADSVLLYRGMDVGSAKPTPEERRGIPHHLLDVWDVTHEATVAEFQQLARRAVDEILARGRVPVVVGGSSLYVRAVVDPLEFPGTDPRVRARWQAELDLVGSEALHAVLAEKDCRAAATILPSNGRRIVRALEVVELTGQPFRASMPDFVSIHDNLTMIGIDVDRQTLDERIAARVERMWADGFVDEVRGLDGLAGSPTASRAIGYQQVLALLAGELTDAEAREATVTGTRKLARRQERTMRKDPRVVWLRGGDGLVERALAVLGGSTDTVG